MTDRIKVSELPLINASSLSINDVFIVNDSDRGDNQTITSGIRYSDVIGSLTSQDLNFTGDVVFNGDVIINGNIGSGPGKDLNFVIDNLTINDSLTIGENATISGIKLDDLDDVNVPEPEDGDALVWDFETSQWIADNISYDNIQTDGQILRENGSGILGDGFAFGEPIDLILYDNVTDVVLSINGQTGDIVTTPKWIKDNGFATRAEGELALTALQPGDNITRLVNNAKYISEGQNVSLLRNDAGYLTSGAVGATGPVGAPGLAGSTGPVGATGAGIDGATGPAGATGATGPQGATGPKGNDGTSVNIVGSVATKDDLEIPYNGDVGDGFMTRDDGHLHVWDGSEWDDAGEIRGPEGPTGPSGATGATGPAGATGPQGTGGVRAIVADESQEPLFPENGLLWYNTDDGVLYIWLSDQSDWVSVWGQDSVIVLDK